MIVDVIGNYVALKKSGSLYKACCPVHHEKTPSLTVWPESDSFYCFGCGVSGDAIDFVMAHDELDFKSALKKVCEITGKDEEKLMTDKKEEQEKKEKQKKKVTPLDKEIVKELIETTGYKANGYRGIRDEINKFFGHLTKLDDKGKVVARYYPETVDDKLTGYKCRNHPKDFSYGKIGETGNQSQLSGQVKFKSGGKYVLLVGGEEDKAAAYQMLLDYAGDGYTGIPVVSPTSGENSTAKQCKAQYDWLDSYDNILIGLDNDTAGNKAALEVAEVLPKEKVKFVKWSGKDPNEMLLNGQQKQFLRDFYNAKEMVGSGIKSSTDLINEVKDELRKPVISLPPYLSKLSAMTKRDGIIQGYIVNIIGDTSVGKCHGKGTPILMYDGSVKLVEDVVVGDKLMGADGSPRNVLSLARGREPMYKIHQNRGISYTVNESHILSLRAGYDVHKGSLNLNQGDVVNISVKDYLSLNSRAKRSLKGYKADLVKLGADKESCFDPYAIGLWLADGTSSKPQITVNKDDVEIDHWLKRFCMSHDYKLSHTPSNDRKGHITWDITNGFRSVLRELELINNKHIPDCYKLGCYNDRLELLSGILDGDGYLFNSMYELTLKNTKLVDDIVFVARSLGFTVKVVDKFSKCQNFEGDVYKRIKISGDIEKLKCKLPRKQGCRKALRKLINTAITIEPLGEGDYFGFTLDGDHLYCLEDLTVTHNTSHINSIVYHWLFNAPERVGIVSLENTAAQYTMDLLSLHLETNLYWMGDGEEIIEYLDKPEVQELYSDLLTTDQGQPRFHIIDERDGDIKKLEKSIERMIKQYDCKIIIIDVLTDILRSLGNDAQEEHMNWQKRIKKSGITICNVLHTRKPQSNQDGSIKKVTEYDALGSSTFVQSADINIVINRDKMTTDNIERNRTYWDIPKLRRGMTGHMGSTYYDPATRKMYDFDDWMALKAQVTQEQPPVPDEVPFSELDEGGVFENIPDYYDQEIPMEESSG